MEDIFAPIDVESNEEEVAETDSRQAKKATAIPTALYNQQLLVSLLSTKES